MRSIISSFIKYPILGNAILFAIFLFGIVSFTSLNTTFFPEVPSKTIMIQASYPGASPEEIEEGIVLKIEDNLKGVTGVDRVTSTSSENSAQVTVELLSGYDVNVVLQDVKNAVDQISSFPSDMERITTFKQEATNFAVSFVVSGDVELKALKEVAREMERDLLSVDGISKLNLSGFPDEEIEISFHENDLRAYGLTFDEVETAIKNANVKMTGGKIKGPKEELLLRANTKGYYAADLANHVIKATSDGAIIRIKDVAELTDRWAEDPNRVYYNGQPAVMISISNTNEEDLFFTSEHVNNYIEEFNASSKDVQASVLRDGSDVVQERADILLDNGVLGLILVLIFLSLSLNSRLSFWVALAIPISFAGMFMLGAAYGLTINVMSLMAMILVIGILVDDGIVIAESIYQHHENGEKPIQAAVNGTLEVLPAVVSSILTTVVIFITFFFLEGRMGDAAKDIAFVVIATLLFSLVEGMFILPSHVAHSKALRTATTQKSRLEQFTDKGLKWFRNTVYAPALRFCIKNPVVAVAVPMALIIITIGALQGSIIKTTFFPVIERDNVDVILEMPAGTPDTITDSLLAEMEESVWAVNESYQQEHGGKDLIKAVGRDIGPNTHEGSLSAILVEGQLRDWSAMETTNRLRDQIGVVEGAENFEVGEGQGQFGKPVSIVLKSDNLQELLLAKDRLKAELKEVAKLRDMVDDDPPGLREVNITLKEKAFALGLTAAQVMDQVRSGFFGGEAQRILRGIDEVKIYVRYKKSDRSTIDKLEDMRIRLTDGREFPLKEIAQLSIKRGVMSINHIDAQRVVTVAASVTDPKESVPDIIADIKAEIMPDITKEYPNVDFDFEGQSRESDKTTQAMIKVIPTIVILMFLIVVVTFRSFMQALIVFLLIPFSLIGVVWGHFVQGYIVSMLSLFGTVALVGIVINDSLVFVSAMNRLLKGGKDFYTALYEAGLSRFRPVLLTSLTTIAGLGPLIFEGSFQAQFLSPMAISVAYGLFFGTLLTLLMLPSLLVLFNRLKVYTSWLLNGSKPSAESVEPAVKEEVFAMNQ